MSTGVVKWFNTSTGYGFILGYDGQDIYFHSSSIADNNADFSSGTRVDFDMISTAIGLEATNVRCSASAA